MKKFFRRINAGLSLMLVGWLACLIGGNAAFRDFLRQLDEYIQTGVTDASWVNKYLR